MVALAIVVVAAVDSLLYSSYLVVVVKSYRKESL
jgi:hypothetical protein